MVIVLYMYFSRLDMRTLNDPMLSLFATQTKYLELIEVSESRSSQTERPTLLRSSMVFQSVTD